MTEYQEMLKNTKTTKGLEIVEELGSGKGLSFLKEEYILGNWTIQIVRSQWTKTQGTWCIRVPNFFTGNKHNLQVPNYTLKQCRQIIETLKTEGIARLWTGHVIKIN